MALYDLQYLNGQILKGTRKTLPVSHSNNICCCCKQRHQSAARALPSQLPITTGLLIPHLPNVPGDPTKPELLPLTVFQDSGMCAHRWTKVWRNELLKLIVKYSTLLIFSIWKIQSPESILVRIRRYRKKVSSLILSEYVGAVSFPGAPLNVWSTVQKILGRITNYKKEKPLCQEC